MNMVWTLRWLIITGTLFNGIHLSSDNASPHFATEIVPILTKAGCNSGACHGAATGKGSFKLSLFAEDAVADFEAISRDRFSR
ncbi:hypothetical protein N8778_05760, partial [Verrucomicrobia bacterium]|nr:hypothetical protein [Verrucomicrobiota bacterium]